MDKITLNIEDVVQELCSTDLGRALWERSTHKVLTEKQEKLITQLENQILNMKKEGVKGDGRNGLAKEVSPS